MRTIAVPMNPFAPETQILREPALVTGSGAGAAPWVRLGLAPLRAFGEADFAVAGFGFAVAAFGFAGTGFGAGDFGLAVAGFGLGADGFGFAVAGFGAGDFGVAGVGAFARRVRGRGSVMPWASGAPADQ
jgi:hypothetical protein